MNFDNMKRLAATGKMSRRDFVQLSVAAGLTTVAGENLFVQSVRAEPKRGGDFKAGFGHGGTTDTLDPATWENSMVADIGNITFDYLVDIDTKNNVAPGLAESWDSNDKVDQWTFQLKKGVEFHNGKTLDANDVVASINHHRGPDTKSAAKSILESIKDVRTDGTDKVVFELTAGSADFPYVVSDYHLPIMPAQDGKVDPQAAIGTGPFKHEVFEPGVRYAATRNDNYHGQSWFDSVEMLTILDVVARQNALTSGDVHYIDRPDLKTLSLMKRNPQLEIDQVTGFGHYVAPMNCTMAPFDNKDVRLALKHAFKRPELVDKVLLGYGAQGNDNPLAKSIKYAIDPEPRHQYDPEKVKFHLKKAGMENLRVDLSASDAAFAGAVDCATLIAEHAKQAGLDINIVREASDGYWSNVWMKKPWCFSYWGGRPTADWMFTTAYAAEAAWNDTFWKNDRFNALLVQARAERDEALRAEMYAEMQNILHDDGGIIVLMFNDFVTAHSKAVAHGELNSNYDHDGGYMYRRWWMA
jgi:peptide/nickel transport system substrate-binding protein